MNKIKFNKNLQYWAQILLIIKQQFKIKMEGRIEEQLK